MDVNYALEHDEVEKGFILTCQSHPKTEKVVVDFVVNYFYSFFFENTQFTKPGVANAASQLLWLALGK